MNFLAVEAARVPSLPSDATVFGFRPEVTHLGHGTPGPGMTSLGKGKVMLVEPLGMTAHVHIKIASSSVVAEVKAAEAPVLDSEIEVSAPENELFFFGADGRSLDTGAIA